MKRTFPFLIAVIILSAGIACKEKVTKDVKAEIQEIEIEKPEGYLLAQWTFHKELKEGTMSNIDFINKAAEMGFIGVEYVNQFFMDKVEDKIFLEELNTTAQKAGILNTLIMIDQAGNLGSSDTKEREQAIEEHKKWMRAASVMSCPNVRVNAHGDGSADEVYSACKESLIELAKYGKTIGVGVIVENHGSYSNDGKWLSSLVGELVPYGVGSLADFDNWCIEREGGVLWGNPCINEYDRYQGIKELLPTAKSISLKAFDFDENGEAIKTDFKKMFDLIKQSQYNEYLSVEFEGETMSPEEGIMKSLALINKYNR